MSFWVGIVVVAGIALTARHGRLAWRQMVQSRSMPHGRLMATGGSRRRKALGLAGSGRLD
jgi:hypothetical protein